MKKILTTNIALTSCHDSSDRMEVTGQFWDMFSGLNWTFTNGERCPESSANAAQTAAIARYQEEGFAPSVTAAPPAPTVTGEYMQGNDPVYLFSDGSTCSGKNPSGAQGIGIEAYEKTGFRFPNSLT